MSVNNKTVVIVTALPLESKAVLRQLMDVVEQTTNGRVSHEGKIDGHCVVVHCFHGMGNVLAGIVTTQIIERCRPAAVVLVGIAGGKKKNDEWSRMLGDIIVADQLIDIESGAQTRKGLEHRPRVYPASARWVHASHHLKTEEWLQKIAVNRPDGSTGRVNPQLLVGTVASAQAVIKHGSHLKAVSKFFTNLLGVEMEGVGAAAAAHHRDVPVDFVMVKSICDWADESKTDIWQSYAADAAAAFAAGLIRRVLAATSGSNGGAQGTTVQAGPRPPNSTVANGSTQFRDHLRDYCRPYHMQDLDKSSIQEMLTTVRWWEIATNSTPIERYREGMPQFLEWLATVPDKRGKPRAPRTRCKHIAAIQTLLDLAGPDGAHLIETPIKFPLPGSIAIHVKRSLTLPEIGRILVACRSIEWERKRLAIPASGFWRSLILFAYNTGMLINAMRQLRWDWLITKDDYPWFHIPANAAGKSAFKCLCITCSACSHRTSAFDWQGFSLSVSLYL